MKAIEEVSPSDEPSDESKQLARKVRAQSGGGTDLPKVGEWYWVKTGKERRMMVVERVYSNHVAFVRHAAEHSSYGERVRHEHLLARVKLELNWQSILMDEIMETRQLISDAAQRLLEDALAKNALSAPAAPGGASQTGLELSLRVTDPKQQKADLLSVQALAKETDQSIAELNKQFAGLCKNLVAADLVRGKEVARQVEDIERKIFVIEVYAGLQEHVIQIAKGEPAGIGEKIAIRQSLLYMDEETLIGYADGGMDFENLGEFDEWIARPENMERCLPEKRGIVAWRVRRERKDYGPAKTIEIALKHLRWHSEDFKTYLLIRNGGNVYRIASDVDFSPRLIPLRTEFDKGFVSKSSNYNPETHRYEEAGTPITPNHMGYDDTVMALRKAMNHYNQIVVLVQGLLDRSEVFHPHAPINLSSAEAIDQWLVAVRDDEDVMDWEGPHWRKYLEANQAAVKPGSMIYSRYLDIGKSGYNAKERPKIIAVERLRGFNKQDEAKYRTFNSRQGRSQWEDDTEIPALGTPGVEVSWSWGTRYGWEHGDYGKWGEWPVNKRRRAWLPLDSLINLSTYNSGDYLPFLNDRKQRMEYELWTREFFAAEDWLHEQANPAVEEQAASEIQEPVSA